MPKDMGFIAWFCMKKKNLQNYENLLGFIDHIQKGIDKFGIPVKKPLVPNTWTESDHAKYIKEKIFDEITAIFGVSKQKTLNGQGHGNEAQAKAMAILLLHKHLCITKTKLAAMFSYAQPNIVGLRIKAFNALRGTGRPLPEKEKRFEKLYEHDGFMEKFNAIDKKIENLKTKKWKSK